MTDDTKPAKQGRRRSKSEQLARLRETLEARRTNRPGDVIDLPRGLTARWIDLADDDGRVAELRALFASLGFEADPSLRVVGVARAEVWTAPVEAEQILFEARVARNRAKVERRSRVVNRAHKAIIDELAERMARAAGAKQ